MSAIRELQVGLVQTLKNDGDLNRYLTGIYDGMAVQGTSIVPPYLVIDSWTLAPEDRMNGFGARVTCALHIWSNYQGTKQGAEIESVIEDIIHQGHNRLVMPSESKWALITLQRTEVTYLMEDSLCHTVFRISARMHKRT